MNSRTEKRDDLRLRLKVRSRTVRALRRASIGEDVSAELRAIATDTAGLAGGDVPGDFVWAWRQALDSLAMAILWAPAIASADVSPIRFRDAARRIAQAALDDNSAPAWHVGLVTALDRLRSIDDPDAPKDIAANLARVPALVRVSGLTTPHERKAVAFPERPHSTDELAPVLVLLSIDDDFIQSPLAVRPNEIYRLGVTVRTPSWPVDAGKIMVDFMCVLPTSVLELGRVLVTQQELSTTTYLCLRGALANSHQPEDVIVRAAYVSSDNQVRQVSVVGHPKFKLTTFDPTSAVPRDLPVVAQHLVSMLAELDAKIPHLTKTDRTSLFVLLESLLRYANRAMQQRRLDSRGPISESEFQNELRAHFAADREIGARIWEAKAASGGFTDLGLEGVVLELKVSSGAVTLDSASQFMSQAAHYSSGLDRPVSILCILDDSKKKEPPGLQSNYAGWLYPRFHGLDSPTYPSAVAVVIIPIRFPTPSVWSK